MILTPDDVKDRKKLADDHKDKPASWWQKIVQIHLDNHMFKCATTVASCWPSVRSAACTANAGSPFGASTSSHTLR